jgi:thiosulfate/3-mercaptopyruvate sulfurtransferase
MKDGAGTFRSREELLRVLNYAQVPPQGRMINLGDSSLEASLGWFVSYELLNNKAARLYVGGLAEWSGRTTSPMVRRVNVGN